MIPVVEVLKTVKLVGSCSTEIRTWAKSQNCKKNDIEEKLLALTTPARVFTVNGHECLAEWELRTVVYRVVVSIYIEKRGIRFRWAGISVTTAYRRSLVRCPQRRHREGSGIAFENVHLRTRQTRGDWKG